MKTHEKALQNFEVKARKIIYKYNRAQSTDGYTSSYVRLSSFFGTFNIRLTQIDEELHRECKGIISRYQHNDRVDIVTLLNGLNEKRHQAKMEFIRFATPGHGF